MNNINNSGNNPCSNCGLCAVSCPHKAIDFGIDGEGFYRPLVSANCTDCGSCVKVCYKYFEGKSPFENAFREKDVYAAWSKNRDVVLASSSGGVGYELTKFYSNEGYKICGVAFDAPNNICKHIIAETESDLKTIRTSKYLQSYTVEAFSEFKKDKKYLVAGTPCQIYGLRKYIQLKKWDDNFILVDFFCHGTPSFNLWKKYKEYIVENKQLDVNFKNVNFREKNPESKWHKNAMLVEDFLGRKFVKNHGFSEDLFFKFFLNNSCLNDACYQCKLRLDYCAADIRIADFWGKKYENNDDGVSLVITNTDKGKTVWTEIKHLLVVEDCNFEDLQQSQGTRYISLNSKRNKILAELKECAPLDKLWTKYFKQSVVKRGFSYFKRILSYIKRTIKK
ncbi:F420H(2):quinone oxidoreductase [Bacteroidia bacterium]|nr:F420H(2):quinone oxidoreductase [Bacteroidia bacterium]